MIFLIRDKIDTTKDQSLVKHIFNLHQKKKITNINKMNKNVLNVDFLR
jgi:DNA replicative helicase MCM subunit Mcm2 (Cdc46/Mcm family)